MGLTVTTDKNPVMVFRNDEGKYPRYSIGISSKDKDGEWIKGYIPCKFKKGVEIENMTKITINNSFYVVDRGDKRNFVSIMIMDFDIENEQEQPIPAGIEELPFK